MTLYVWPALLMPEAQQWSPSAGAARDGGRSLSGSRRVATWAGGGIWRARFRNVAVGTPDEVLTAQALDALLNDGVEPIAVPRNPGEQGPGGLVAYTPFSDGSTFSDGTEFASAAPYGLLDGSVAAYATTISFTWPGDALRGGEDFSFETPDGPNLHRIGRFESIEAIEGGYAYTAEVRTPIRAAQSSGAELNFINPHATMRMTNARELSAMLELNRIGFFDAEFEEA